MPRPLCIRIIRTYSIRRYSTKKEDLFNYNPQQYQFEGGPSDVERELAGLQRVTASQLATRDTLPTGIKMLVRDFVQDSLYNPQYGYFTKRATIFSPSKPIPFHNLRETAEFQSVVAELYSDYNRARDKNDGPGKQVWHTPTELFKPYYGQAIAQCLVSEYLLKYFPYEDFVIYEIGAGNGTLSLNILDFLQTHYPEVYDRTQYHIVEISPRLAKAQRELLAPHALAVKVINQDIFTWNTLVSQPCFFLALEVIDNFPHDELRYSFDTLQPYQGLIAVAKDGEMHQIYEPVQDPLIKRFLSYRARTKQKNSPIANPSRLSQAVRTLRRFLPLAPNMTKSEYIPTQLLVLLEILASKFPLHRLLLSDFSSLPDTIAGHNAPVVQTRVNDIMVPCKSITVRPGYFDIFFPTSFELLQEMYELVLYKPSKDASRPSPMSTSASSLGLGADFFSSSSRRPPVDGMTSNSGLPVGQRRSSVYSHREFIGKYGDPQATRLKNGENPMLDFYQNVKFLF